MPSSLAICSVPTAIASPAPALSDATRALRALVRSRDDLVAARVALANQLRALLDCFWPEAGRSSPTSIRPSPSPS